MIAFRHRTPATVAAPAADRALGQELQLIELVHRQELVGEHHPEHARLQDEVDALMGELAEIALAAGSGVG